MNAVVGKVSVCKDSSMSPGTVGEVPAMYFSAVISDQSDGAWGGEVRKEAVPITSESAFHSCGVEK